MSRRRTLSLTTMFTAPWLLRRGKQVRIDIGRAGGWAAARAGK